jgi:hypothetical protein
VLLDHPARLIASSELNVIIDSVVQGRGDVYAMDYEFRQERQWPETSTPWNLSRSETAQ